MVLGVWCHDFNLSLPFMQGLVLYPSSLTLTRVLVALASQFELITTDLYQL